MAVVAVLLALAAVPITAIALREFADGCKKSVAHLDQMPGPRGKTLPVRNAVILLLCIYGAGISALVRANFNYVDDIGRAVDGYRQWNILSRYLAEELSTVLNANRYLSDISPLTQILAVLILAISSVLLLMVVLDRTRFTLWEIIAVTPLCLNPYFLECLSYKFDSPYMALSILGAVFPLVYRRSSPTRYILAATAGTLVVCTTYQAATGIFPMAVILLAFTMWQQKSECRSIVRMVLYSVIGYGSGLVIFRAMMMRPLESAYVSASLPAPGDFLSNVLQNLKEYYEQVNADLTPFWKVLVVLLLVAFWVSAVLGSQRGKAKGLMAAAVVTACLFLTCFGMYPILSSPLFAPRGMYAFGALIAMVGISIASAGKNPYVRIPAVVIAWTFFVFSFTYGNALSYQKSYTEFRTHMVISDLSELITSDDTEEPVVVQIEGDIGFSPVVQSMAYQYPILNRLIPQTLSGSWNWGVREFYNYYALKNVVWDPWTDLETYNLPLLKETMYQTIYGNDQYILVSLK